MFAKCFGASVNLWGQSVFLFFSCRHFQVDSSIPRANLQELFAQLSPVSGAHEEDHPLGFNLPRLVSLVRIVNVFLEFFLVSLQVTCKIRL